MKCRFFLLLSDLSQRLVVVQININIDNDDDDDDATSRTTTNLATTNLNIIFHDLKEPTEKQAEKGEKPRLCFSYVQGTKVPHLFEGKAKEEVLMKEYESEFSDVFTITDFSVEKGQKLDFPLIQ